MERWKRIKAVFEIAAALPPGRREAYLDEACAGEPEIRQEVESLLTASGNARQSMELEALRQSAASLIENLQNPVIGRRVGNYRITGEVGRGGMGEVYRATRADDHFEQQVAIKIVKRGMDTDFILRRFRNERQILADLDHPNIARLLDGGATDDGLPYYVMEFIEGKPIDEYCRMRQLSTRDRLRLFLPVCSAVHFAHQKRVVHRDIKPGNILITDQGTPKLLDFGIAKILHPDQEGGPAEPTITQTSFRMMTPAYASPEQVRGQPITPASDVYSLGVLLYELLTDHRPYELKGRAPHEMAHLICETDPDRPSTAAGKGEQGKKLRQSLEGDLDSIVLMAIRKEPQRRYSSAETFADDIKRHLDGLPVEARSETAGYRWRKLAWRHRARALAGISALAVAGVVGWQAYELKTTGARSGSKVKARPSVAVVGFKNLSGRPEAAWLSTALTEMLGTELAAGEQLRTVAGERVAGARIDLSLAETDSFGRDTLTRIRTQLGADYVVVGSYLATGGVDSGIRLDVRLQDVMAGETLVTATDSGRESDLPALVARAGARIRERLGIGRLSGLEAERTRAASPANASAARLYSEGVQRLRVFDTVAAKEFLEKAAAADPNHALTHSALAMALTSLGDDAGGQREAKLAFDLSKDLSRENRLFVEGRYYETINSWEKAAGIYQALFGFFPDSLDYGVRLAAAQWHMGRGQDALRTLDELRRLPPPERDDARIDLEENIAAKTVSDYKRALAASERATAKGRAQGSRIMVARAMNEEGEALAALGQTERAIQRLEESRSIYQEMGHQRGMARALLGLGDVKMQGGELEAALKLYQQALDTFRQIGTRTGIAASLHNIAVIMKQRGDFDEAEKLYREALAIRREIGERQEVAVTLNGLANTLLEQGSLGEVKEMYTEALTIARDTGSRRLAGSIMANLGEALRNLGDLATAKSTYLESVATRRQLGDEAGLAIVLQGLGELLLDQGDLAGAKNALKESLGLHRQMANKRGIAYSLWESGLVTLAEGDVKGAKALQEEALAIRGEIGEKASEAQSRLALAEVNFEMGFAELSQMMAGQAVTRFRAQRARHWEAWAQARLAFYLAARKKIPESEQAAQRASQLLEKLEFRPMRIASGTALARVAALNGRHAEAIRSLEALLQEAGQIGLVPNQLEIRLALGEIEIQSGQAAKGRARLGTLRGEATGRGFGLIARKAAAAPVN
jgi:serine/threonine protein kinase/tetratricopeptide (TPR) repeat protein